MFSFVQKLFANDEEPKAESYSLAEINAAIITFGLSAEQLAYLNVMDTTAFQKVDDPVTASENKARAAFAWFNALNIEVPDFKRQARRTLLVGKCIKHLGYTLTTLFQVIEQDPNVDRSIYQRFMNYQAIYITLHADLNKKDSINNTADLLQIVANNLAAMDLSVSLLVYQNALNLQIAVAAELVLAAHAFPIFSKAHQVAKDIYDFEPTIENRANCYNLTLQYQYVVHMLRTASRADLTLPELHGDAELLAVSSELEKMIAQLNVVTQAPAMTLQYQQQVLLLEDKPAEPDIKDTVESDNTYASMAAENNLYSVTPSYGSGSTLRRRIVHNRHKYL